MPRERVDSHPIRTASTRYIWWNVGGALLPGAILLATTLQSGQPITGPVLGGAALAVLLPLAAGETARRRTVRDAEADATPWRAARNDRGERLLSRTAAVLDELLDDRLREHGYDLEPAPPAPAAEQPGPTGTSAWPATRPGPPSVAQPLYGGDYAGDAAREHDEQRAREAIPAGHAGARLGRAVARPRTEQAPGPRHDRPDQAAGRRSG